ncbi:MAG: HAMP domain-containing protein [Candidatus Dormibacteraeota bacterium]|nr:HAMP domain-containing protein [Candidatus Dormibacteraeota bacterium]
MRLDPRRRFRDRLLVGMVAVALLPLVCLAILAAIELDSISSGTAAQAQGAILRDEEARQQSTDQSRAGLLDSRTDGIGYELQSLAEAVTTALSSNQPAAPLAGASSYRGDQYTGSISDPSSVITSQAPSPDQLKLIAAGAALVPRMQVLRHDYPEIETVWIASTNGIALRAVPGLDVKGALDEGLLDPDKPDLRAGTDVFGASQQRIDSSAPGHWVDPTSGARKPGSAYWTDTYSLMATGQGGVTAWVPLHDGHTLVGADVASASLVTAALTRPDAPQFPPAAYPLLLSSDGSVVYADPDATADFPSSGSLSGAKLPLPKDAHFTNALRTTLASGAPGVLRTQLGGRSKDVFTAPVYGAHWILATPVAVSELQPDLTGLTHGIAAGVHALFPVVVLPALALLLALAFIAATLLSRRLVVPVRRLTDAAEVLAAGRTDVPVPPQGTDEVGVLAATLERMRREINTSRETILAASAQLEARVEHRTAELRSRNDELVALNDLAASLTRSLETSVILDDALDAVRAIHPLIAGRGYVLDGESLLLAATWTAPSGDGAASAAQLDAAAARSVAERQPVAEKAGRRMVVSWPLVTQQGAVGALAVEAEREPRRETRRLLQAVADQVALALRTARLSAAGREHAVLEERTRLAREIHDTLAQQLTGIVLQLEAAETLVERGSDRALSSVSIAHDLARSALQEARRSVWNLRPAPLAAIGVIAAIQREVNSLEERTGTTARFRARSVPPRPSLQPAAEVALLRIVQEALSNVARHSGASRVDVSLRSVGSDLVLSVRDDGRGFDTAAEPSRSDCFGLEGMRERVRLAGGSLVVTSAPDRGTEVTARVPLWESGAVEHTA